jgi:hypothetical protein
MKTMELVTKENAIEKNVIDEKNKADRTAAIRRRRFA